MAGKLQKQARSTVVQQQQQQLASPLRFSLHYNRCSSLQCRQPFNHRPLLLKCPGPTVCRNSENATAPAARPAIVSSGAACCLQPLPPAASTVLIRPLVSAWLGTCRRGPFCWLLKMDRNCDGHGDTSSHQHLGCRQCTDGEAKQRRLHDAGGVQQILPAVEGNSKRRRLRSQNKAAQASLSQCQRTRRAFLHSRSRREMLVREWGKLGSAIRRAAAVCLAPSAGADEEDELDLPYVQLDKVTTRAVRREAFGPLYLVT